MCCLLAIHLWLLIGINSNRLRLVLPPERIRREFAG
nr:MAG TPA: hypothetical protein [Caudoviricetes sp.]